MATVAGACFLFACGGGSSSGDDEVGGSFSAPDGFSYGPFDAYYYAENDGTSPGVGTDGSDPGIIPTLVAADQSDYLSINYSYDAFEGINSYNFFGVWEGSLSVNESGIVYANFDVSWANVRFYLDGELVLAWQNSNQSIR